MTSERPLLSGAGRNVTIPAPSQIEQADRNIATRLLPTPTCRMPGSPVTVKLECLQPTGSFKVRGAWNALATQVGAQESPVRTASAGNMARALAWAGADVGRAVVASIPEGAPQNKVDAVRDLGAEIEVVSYDDWWRILDTHGAAFGGDNQFVHPFASTAVMAGNATIARELVEQVKEFDVVLVALGGGGLACGLAAGLRAMGHEAEVVVVEVEGTAPLTAAFAAGDPVTVEARRSFVDGAGSPRVRDEMWPLLREAVTATVTVSLEEVRSAVRLLAADCNVVAEGAGALPVAAASSGRFGDRRVACIVSGGNIDLPVLAKILRDSPSETQE